MANIDHAVVRLDKRSLDAINRLAKAVESNNQILRKQARETREAGFAARDDSIKEKTPGQIVLSDGVPIELPEPRFTGGGCGDQ